MVFTEAIIGGYLLLNAYKHTRIFIFKRRLRKNSYKIIKGAEPFYCGGNSTGVLLIHGFSQTPAIWREYANKLKEKGFTVYVPLLPGHGTSPEHLSITTLEEWEAAVDNAISVIKKKCKKVILAGVSFGGNLIISGVNGRNDISGIILMATPVMWVKRRRRMILFHIARQLKIFQKKNYLSNLKKFPAIKQYITPEFTYGSIPLRSLSQCIKGVEKTKKMLNTIHMPVLILQSQEDDIVDPRSARYIYDNIKSKIKKLVFIRNSYHTPIIDSKSHIAFREMTRFINRIHIGSKKMK